MRAGIVTAPRRFELVEFDPPIPAPGAAVVEVHLCGVCGTDVHGYLGPEPYNPAICGHELVGTVVAVGDGVRGLDEGRRVVAGIAPPCGRCTECRAGRTTGCTTAFLGMIGRDPLAPPHGGFAPRVAYDAARLIAVPEPLSDEQAALVEPATVAYHALARTPPRPSDVVVVQGCGPIGLLAVQCARAFGAGHVVAVEPHAARRGLAAALGADEALTPDEARERFARTGADLVLECAGVPAAVQAAVELARRGGVVNLVGVATGAATIQPGSWLVKEVTVTTSLGYLHHEFAATMGLVVDGRLDVGALPDRTIGLDDLPATIAELADEPSRAVKVLVDPRAG